MHLHAHVGTGFCFWEKTNSGCKDTGERFEFDAYDFYEVCRTSSKQFREFQCRFLPKPINAGKCKERTSENSEDQRLHCVACARSAYLLRDIAFTRRISAWKTLMPLHVLAEGYVLIAENSQCSSGVDTLDVDLAPGCVIRCDCWTL